MWYDMMMITLMTMMTIMIMMVMMMMMTTMVLIDRMLIDATVSCTSLAEKTSNWIEGWITKVKVIESKSEG